MRPSPCPRVPYCREWCGSSSPHPVPSGDGLLGTLGDPTEYRSGDDPAPLHVRQTSDRSVHWDCITVSDNLTGSVDRRGSRALLPIIFND